MAEERVDPKALRITILRAQRYLTRQRDEVVRLMGVDTPEDERSLFRHIRHLEIQTEMLKSERQKFDELLAEYEQLTSEEESDTVIQEREGWGDLVHSALGNLTEAWLHLGDLHALDETPAHPPDDRSEAGDTQDRSENGQNPTPSNLPPSSPAGAEAQNGNWADAQSSFTGSNAQNVPGSDAQNAITQNLTRLLDLIERREQQHNQSGGSNSQSTSRLPKLELTKFGGDVLKWRPFWDRFAASVDSNSKLAKVEKLNYLMGLLEGEALLEVQSLPLIADNYDVAVASLQKRYGCPKLLIGKLYRRLNEMRSVPNKHTELRKFVAEIDCLMGSLGALGQNTSDDNFATIILSKLPILQTVVLSLELLKDIDTPWSVELVRKKLTEYLIRLERSSQICSGHSNPPKPGNTAEGLLGSDGGKTGGKKLKGGPVPKQKGGGASGGSKKSPTCAFCQKGHYSDKCTDFPTADARYAQLGQKCYNCLKAGHRVQDCPSSWPCHYCSMVKSHNSALCRKKFGASSGTKGHGSPANLGDAGSASPPGNSQDTGMLAAGEEVILQTALIPIKGAGDHTEFKVARGVFDPGCNKTYCSRKLSKELSLPLSSGPTLTVNRFGPGGPVSMPTHTSKVTVRRLDGSEQQIDVSVVDQITGSINRAPVKVEQLSRMAKSLKLADEFPSRRERAPVDFLIGNDHYLDFITGRKKQVADGLYLLGSDFGWILSGRIPETRDDAYVISMCGFASEATTGLEGILPVPNGDPVAPSKPPTSDLWSLETLGIKDEPSVSDDYRAIEDFKEHITQENGRYFVSLPKNEQILELQTDYKLSEGRFKSLGNKLSDDPSLLAKYNDIIQDQLEKGVIEKVPEVHRETPSTKVHYIPHHPVIKPERETTKVRVVFDGSAKTRKSSPSLNQCLYRGPILLEDLVGILMRFRFHPIAIIADIEKAFLQIGIRREDRDLTRFLWYKDPTSPRVDGNIQEYRFARVPFGLNCSPSLLAQTVQHHLQADGGSVAKKILGDLYVDNVITGVDTGGGAEDFYKVSKKIFREALMNLRCWSSSSSDFLGKIPNEDKVKSEETKVLGMNWSSTADTLSLQGPSQENLEAVSTRRQLLSALSTVFDPLGIASPCTVRGKLLLQTIVHEDNSWDSPVPNEILSAWSAEIPSLMDIGSISIPRFVPVKGKVMLIAFCDASSHCFATVIYVRVEIDGVVNCSLLFSKSRLNPAKKLTIPRLELMGILIGKRALKFVAKQSRLPVTEMHVFSDSKVALAWVKAPKGSDQFVKNRVREIQDLSNVTAHYVHTEQNPADWATRGKQPSELNSFWFHGPTWVVGSPNEWQQWGNDSFPVTKSDDLVKHSEITLPASAAEVVMFMTIEIARFSSLYKLLRVTALCLRFVHNLRAQDKVKGTLQASDLASARLAWEKQIQGQTYPTVKSAIRKGHRHEMSNLGLFVDQEGLLRVKGRLGDTNLEWGQRYPKLIPKKHPFSVLLVKAAHAKCGHGSTNHTLIQLQAEYWIPKARSLVQQVIRRCVICKRASGKPYGTPPMPELPTSRVTPQAPFSFTGVDYFGPLKVKEGGQSVKCWVALFTCLTVRAVHLELVMDLSATEFLMSLRRFISRRRQPVTMICDNAPQFKLVAKATEVAWQKVTTSKEVTNFFANTGINWVFIPENAPYMGGVYERMVGVVKTCLRKTVGQALLTAKQFETILCECEATVNSRPLVYPGSEMVPHGVLTPSHFLSLNSSSVTSDQQLQGKSSDLPDLQGASASALVEDWKKGQRLLNEFWKLWSSEYLNTLRERSRYQRRHKSRSPEKPKLGHVVLMKEQGLPRGSWKLARVSKLQESQDGQVRSVILQLPNGREFRRPVSLLIPIEVSDPASQGRGQSSNAEQNPDDSVQRPAIRLKL